MCWAWPSWASLSSSHDPPRGVQRQWWLVDSLLPEILTQRALLRAVMKKSQRPTWGPLGNPEITIIDTQITLKMCVMMNWCCVNSPVASASDGWTYWLAGGVDMIHTSCTTAVWTHTHIATIPFHMNFPPLNSHSIIICVPFSLRRPQFMGFSDDEDEKRVVRSLKDKRSVKQYLLMQKPSLRTTPVMMRSRRSFSHWRTVSRSRM